MLFKGYSKGQEAGFPMFHARARLKGLVISKRGLTLRFHRHASWYCMKTVPM